MIVYINVNARLEYWSSRPEYPRTIYIFALIGLFVAAAVSGFVELLRSWVFERRDLLWWQVVVVCDRIQSDSKSFPVSATDSGHCGLRFLLQ